MAGLHATPRSGARRGFFVAVSIVALVLAGIAGTLITLNVSSSDSAVRTSSPASRHLGIVASTPPDTSTVDAGAAIRVALSSELSSSSPMPSISPAIPGSWVRLSGSTLEFVQSTPLAPGQTVTVTIPGGPSGLRSSSGATLAASVTSTFHVAPLSTLRVQQLLAELGYLPLTFTPTAPSTGSGVLASDELGTFSWRWPSLPASLTSLWSPGTSNTITRGAIMRFEDTHGMATDGTAGPQVWSALLAERAAGHVDPDPYTYVSVSKALPQSLQLYSNGQIVYSTAVNTGIPGQDTASGTFPVYLRYKVTTMSGTNPDGTKYHDTGIPWTSYFNGGDALHGFIRPSYGSPQSLGCVEMPFANAGIVWPQTPIGTLVTVL